MDVSLQPMGVVGYPPTVTVLVPCEAPKFCPEIVMKDPIRPDSGVAPVIVVPALDTKIVVDPVTVLYPDTEGEKMNAIVLRPGGSTVPAGGE